MANFRIRSHPGKAGYHQHVYPNGRVVVVKGAHHSAAEGGGGVGSTGASSFTSTADAYGGGGIPLDPIAENQRAVNNQQIALGNAQDLYDTNRLSNEYGIGDTSNPYSRAKLLEQTFRRSQAANTGSYAARGQLYSGALQTQLNEDQNQFNKGTDSMNRAYQASMNEINKRRGDRYASAGMQMDDATYQSLLRSLGA